MTKKQFYDNSILPGTKMNADTSKYFDGFYDNSILPGTKIFYTDFIIGICFTITQFFQVLKSR